jgi:glyoxylase-like metal-dependent hydrolase (beta-lactamase superfamily II)
MHVETYLITPTLRLLNVQPQIAGHDNFIGPYLFCGQKKAIVDPGPKAAIPQVMSALEELGMSPGVIDYIVLTHIHIDHAGGTGMAVKEMTKAKVIAHPRAIPHLIDPAMLWKASVKTLGDIALKWGNVEPVPEDRIVAAEDLMQIDLGSGLVLEIHYTPGHAPHHLSLLDRTNGLLIAGETAGVCIAGTVRPSTPPPFNLEEVLFSIDRLIDLKPKRLCYGHFGCYDDALERLQLIKQKILTWNDIVKSAVKVGKNPEDIFLTLREIDRSLDYLDLLNQEEHRRERTLLINSIIGLSQAARELA